MNASSESTSCFNLDSAFSRSNSSALDMPSRPQATGEMKSLAAQDGSGSPTSKSASSSVEYVEDVNEAGCRPPELTEASTAASIRLVHRIFDLQEVVGMWSDFKDLGLNGSASEYLTRCYVGEVLLSWRSLQQQYRDVIWLRANGNGSQKPPPFERELGKLIARVADWRNRCMPRHERPTRRPAPPVDRRPAGSSSVIQTTCGTICERTPLSTPSHPLSHGIASHSWLSKSASVSAPGLMPVTPGRADSARDMDGKRGSRALGLVEILIGAMKTLKLSKSQLELEIDLLRKELMIAQYEWHERRLQKQQVR